MKKAFILLIQLFSIEIAFSQDHLEPVNGFFDSYHFQIDYFNNIRQILLKDLSDNPEIRYLILPSFEGEAVIDVNLDEITNKYFIVLKYVTGRNIWYEENKKKIVIKTIKKELSKNSFTLLKNLFTKAVLSTRFPKNDRIGADGTKYFFTVNYNSQKSGCIWSPRENTKMKRLVEFGDQLIILMQRKKSKLEFDQNTAKKIKQLIKEIN